MTDRPSRAFLFSALLHGGLVAVILLFTYLGRLGKEPPKIFELVAGEGDNYGATEAPAQGTPGGAKVEFNAPPAPVPSPSPAPPAPEPAPPAPEPAVESPIAPTPEPPQPVEAPKPKPVPKPVNLAKMIERTVDRQENKARREVQKQRVAEEKARKAAEERAAKEAALNARRMTKEEFDRVNKGKGASPSSKPPAGGGGNPSKATRIDAEGIAGGVVGGSTANKTGGAGGKVLSREEMALSDAYISIIIQRLREAHRKPEGLSDLLQAKVEFRLNANGTLSGVTIARSSGNREFDQSVLDAFERLALPKPPANLKPEVYSVTFKMKEE